MQNSAERAEKLRFDDLVRSERYFTATLLPAVLFHEYPKGVQRFIKLIDDKSTTECDRDGNRRRTGATSHETDDVEVITEFHIARDLKDAGLIVPGESAEEGEQERRVAPDLVIVAGSELVVCEGKFFSAFNVIDLNEQLESQRRQVRYLFCNRQIRAYRHVAIMPEALKLDVDVVLTWDDIAKLAAELMGLNHYVTVRLNAAVKRYKPKGDQRTLNYDGVLEFEDMRKKCREVKNNIEVGYMGGSDELLRALVEADRKKKWKWADPATNKGVRIKGNWLDGARWLEIVESKHGISK